MSNTLKAYHDSVRALDQAETDYKHGSIDTDTLHATRLRAHEARQAWEAERDTLTEIQRVRIAAQAAREDVAEGRKDRAEDELTHTKRLIKECRRALREARYDNKALYARLAANRETKRQLNAEYERLRARKQELEQVKP